MIQVIETGEVDTVAASWGPVDGATVVVDVVALESQSDFMEAVVAALGLPAHTTAHPETPAGNLPVLLLLEGLDILVRRDLHLVCWLAVGAPRLLHELGVAATAVAILTHSNRPGTVGIPARAIPGTSVETPVELCTAHVAAPCAPWFLHPGAERNLPSLISIEGTRRTSEIGAVQVRDLVSDHSSPRRRLLARLAHAFPTQLPPTGRRRPEGAARRTRLDQRLPDLTDSWPRRAVLVVHGLPTLAALDLRATLFVVDLLDYAARTRRSEGFATTVVYALPMLPRRD